MCGNLACTAGLLRVFAAGAGGREQAMRARRNRATQLLPRPASGVAPAKR